MSFRHFRNLIMFPIGVLAASAMFAVLTARYDRNAAIAEACIVVALAIFYCVWFFITKRQYTHIMLRTVSKFDLVKKKSLASFPLPVLVTDSIGNIELFNNSFAQDVMKGKNIENSDISELGFNAGIEQILTQQGFDIKIDSRYYSVYSSETQIRDKTFYIFYFLNNTELKAIQAEYNLSRPAVIFISLDGDDELQKKYSNNEYSEISLEIDKIMRNWASQYDCIYRKTDSDSYMIFAEHRNLVDMQAKRFVILEDIRNFSYKEDNVGATLSIGVGRGANFAECESNARQALDMAQSRGGDQAAIRKDDATYDFIGGISKGVEKKTKVRTRMMASSIAELIKASSNVIIVGHKFPDLDAVGSAIGLCAAAVSLGKHANIAIDKAKSLAEPLIDRLYHDGMGSLAISPQEAFLKTNKNTLLIVVDTHIVDFVDVPELLNKTSTIVVVDHHRKSINFIDNATLFFHDPSTSSTSEMVTELLQYMDSKPIIGKLEADALLSGIMLDTRNFILRSGVRTFEAAAYLKSRGADTVRVKKMFSSSLNSYKLRNQIVSDSTMFRNCAFSVVRIETPDIRIICSQAADELLNITNVDASFVIFESRGVVNISARSLGNMNVQVIMESLGGGGHQTMAAAQIEGIEIDTVIARLQKAVDDYYSSSLKR